MASNEKTRYKAIIADHTLSLIHISFQAIRLRQWLIYIFFTGHY